MEYALNLIVGFHRQLFILLFFVFTLLIFSDASAENFHNAHSLQGFTGLFNTPNAEVTDEGKLYALYSNQRDNEFANRDASEDSYMFSVGFFSFAELGGRLTQAPNIHDNGGTLRDLSANFKFKVPFIPQGHYLPSIAFGIQDVGGGAKNMQTSYLVVTEELWRLRMSVGYGFGPDRMDGLFGGVELKACEWFYLVGENDTKETNVGVRVVTPEAFNIPVNLQLTAKTSLDYKPGNFEFGLGLQFPLGFDRHNRTPLNEAPTTANLTPLVVSLPEEEKLGSSGVAVDRATGAPAKLTGGKKQPDNQEDDTYRIAKLIDELVADGFENVQIGRNGEVLLVVEYENGRYDHNELDGLGVVIGTVVDTIASDNTMLRLVLKKKGIRVLQVSAPISEFRGFLENADRLAAFNASLKISTEVTEDADVRFIERDTHSSWLRSALVVYPGIKTYVGTEVGLFDYLLSARLDYFVNAWKGAVVNARLDIPVSWSENFDNGKPFRDSRNGSQIDRLMLFQALKPANDLMINLGAGMVMHDTYGTINEVSWAPGNSNHLFMLKQAYFEASDEPAQQENREIYLGSYRYYVAPLDLYLTGTAGRFYDNDKGISFELKRFFGDTSFSVFYKDSRTANHDNVQMGGVQVSFPLTPRRGMKPSLVQLKGSDEWSYTQATEIASSGQANSLEASIGVNPMPSYNLERVFYNRGRLSEPYIREHLLRLRDAYITYKQP